MKDKRPVSDEATEEGKQKADDHILNATISACFKVKDKNNFQHKPQEVLQLI